MLQRPPPLWLIRPFNVHPEDQVVIFFDALVSSVITNYNLTRNFYSVMMDPTKVVSVPPAVLAAHQNRRPTHDPLLVNLEEGMRLY